MWVGAKFGTSRGIKANILCQKNICKISNRKILAQSSINECIDFDSPVPAILVLIGVDLYVSCLCSKSTGDIRGRSVPAVDHGV